MRIVFLLSFLSFFKMSSLQADSRWSDYYDFSKNAPPHEHTWSSVRVFEDKFSKQAKKLAIDLGCGEGRDTFFFAERGFDVLAIDNDEDGIRRLQASSHYDPKKIEVRLQDFESIEELPQADFINAMLSIEFLEKPKLMMLWSKMLKALKPGGVISGTLFGEKFPDELRFLNHTFSVQTDFDDGSSLSFDEFSKLFEGIELYYYAIEMNRFTGYDKLYPKPHYFFIAVKEDTAKADL